MIVVDKFNRPIVAALSKRTICVAAYSFYADGVTSSK